MSRIGSNPIQLPTNVTINIDGPKILITGPLGNQSIQLVRQVSVKLEDGIIHVARKKDDKSSRSLHGLYRALVANAILGVEKGWEKNLELVGVGFRAQSSEVKLTLNVGYSHPVEIDAPEGIKFSVTENKVKVSGIDKELVGQVAAKVRQVRPPEPYKGKGIRYVGEYVRRKAGKAGKVGAGGAK